MSALNARVQVSLARMYVHDFQAGHDFNRMVDGKGSVFPTASRDGWLAHIRNIITSPEVLAHCAEQVAGIVGDLAALGLSVDGPVVAAAPVAVMVEAETEEEEEEEGEEEDA